MKKTRRDILALMGGAAAGAAFTPVPWRLITDAALWSENWPGIPHPARGAIKTKFTNCALCPAGCGVRARCVGEQPVALAGVPDHPLSRGALCPFGLTGHHLPYHPERLKQGPTEAAVAAVRSAAANLRPNETIALLDLRPGRAISFAYRQAMGTVKNGTYIGAPLPLGGAAVDLSKARAVLSFAVPVMDGWGTPGSVLAARSGFRLIQAEAIESRTAALADEWLAVKPGSEATLALAIANVLLEGGAAGREFPAELAARARELPPSQAAAATGLAEEQIVATARELSSNGPSVVLAGPDLPEALALNLLTGAYGQSLAARREAPIPESWKKAAPVTDLASAPDGSIRALLIDESAPGDYIPWGAIEKKLVRDNPVVVTFAWSREGYGRHAQFTLPTAVFPEAADEIPAAVDSPVAAFRISAPLVAPPAGITSAAEFLGKAGLAAGAIDPVALLRERADAIHKSGRGALFAYADGASTPVKEMKPDDFWKALNEGGCWIDGEAAAQGGALALGAGTAQRALAESGEFALAVALAEGGATAEVPASPLMSKIYRESNLRLGRGRAALNPDSARECGLEDGGRAMLETGVGKCGIEVIVDDSIPPGIVKVAAGPEVLDICGAASRARVVRA